MTSSERPRCIWSSHSFPNSSRPERWLFARRTPFATASSFPLSLEKSVTMRYASPKGRARRTMPRVLYERVEGMRQELRGRAFSQTIGRRIHNRHLRIEFDKDLAAGSAGTG